MKPLFRITMAAASILTCQTIAIAQTGPHVPQGPLPPASTGADRILPPSGSPTVPSRRIPSLTPPQRDSTHPFTPEEAWPKDSRPREPLDQPVKPDDHDDSTMRTPLDKEPRVYDDTLEKLRGAY